MKLDKMFLAVMISIMIGAVVVLTCALMHRMHVAAKCLRAGYPSAITVYDDGIRSYCLKRVNQTDVVVPTEDVRQFNGRNF